MFNQRINKKNIRYKFKCRAEMVTIIFKARVNSYQTSKIG
jgi:hypothetical protein